MLVSEREGQRARRQAPFDLVSGLDRRLGSRLDPRYSRDLARSILESDRRR